MLLRERGEPEVAYLHRVRSLADNVTIASALTALRSESATPALDALKVLVDAAKAEVGGE